MLIKELSEVEASLIKMKKVSRVLSHVLKVAILLFSILFLFSIFVILGAVVEMVFSIGVLPVAQTENVIVNYYDSSAGSNTPSINLASVLGAALLYVLSFVFRYGALLQEFTDDTL